MNKDQFIKQSKKFTENINLAMTEEFLLLSIFSGESAEIYALTPQHFKRFVQMMDNNLLEYEKKFGEIKANWSAPIKSPFIDPEDLKNNQK